MSCVTEVTSPRDSPLEECADAASQTQRVNRCSQQQAQRSVPQSGQVPQFLAREFAGDGLFWLAESRMVRCGAHHEHFAGTGADRNDVRVNVHDGVGAALRCLMFQSLQGQMPRVVVHVGELFDLTAGEAAQESEDSPAMVRSPLAMPPTKPSD